MSNDTMPARPLTANDLTLARLFVYGPEGQAAVVPLRGASLTMGRRESNGLTLADRRASGEHAIMRRRRDSGRWQVEDQGSTNGTWVMRERRDEAVLESGDVFRIGDTLLILEVGPRGAHDDGLGSIEAATIEGDLARLRRSEAPVLILGDTGSGKGHYARRIADGSPVGEPFVHVNCAALPSNLVEAELFGYEKGAFTGANAAKKGLVETADGGTLFLDEIGELAPELQAKLLTTLEDGLIRRVGSTDTRKVTIRLLAATNVSIESAIEAGTFREDLYFRLAAHTLRVPALSKRRADVVPIFLNALGVSDHSALTAETLEALLTHEWPGNVRELLNVAQTLRSEDNSRIDYRQLPDVMNQFLKDRAGGQTARPIDPTRVPMRESTAESVIPPKSREIPLKSELVAALNACDGNISELARQYGKHRNQVVRWLDAYGLRQQ